MTGGSIGQYGILVLPLYVDVRGPPCPVLPYLSLCVPVCVSLSLLHHRPSTVLTRIQGIGMHPRWHGVHCTNDMDSHPRQVPFNVFATA